MFKLQKKITIVVNQEPFQNQQTIVALCCRFTFSHLINVFYPFCKREIERSRRRKKIEKSGSKEIEKAKQIPRILFFSVSPFRLVDFSISLFPDIRISWLRVKVKVKVKVENAKRRICRIRPPQHTTVLYSYNKGNLVKSFHVKFISNEDYLFYAL